MGLGTDPLLVTVNGFLTCAYTDGPKSGMLEWVAPFGRAANENIEVVFSTVDYVSQILSPPNVSARVGRFLLSICLASEWNQCSISSGR